MHRYYLILMNILQIIIKIYYQKFDTNYNYKCRSKLNNEHQVKRLLNYSIDLQAKSQQNQHNKMEHTPFATAIK